MQRTDHGAALVVDEMQIEHGRYNNKNSSKRANWCWFTPSAWQEIEGSEQRTKNHGKTKFSPAHMPPNVELTGAARPYRAAPSD